MNGKNFPSELSDEELSRGIVGDSDICSIEWTRSLVRLHQNLNLSQLGATRVETVQITLIVKHHRGFAPFAFRDLSGLRIEHVSIFSTREYCDSQACSNLTKGYLLIVDLGY